MRVVQNAVNRLFFGYLSVLYYRNPCFVVGMRVLGGMIAGCIASDRGSVFDHLKIGSLAAGEVVIDLDSD